MSKYLEIVQLSDGSFVLQNSEESEEPLVRIEFSQEVEHILKEQIVDVATVMIDAGIRAASAVGETTFEDYEPLEGELLH